MKLLSSAALGPSSAASVPLTDDVNGLSVSYVRRGNTLPIRVPYLIPGIYCEHPHCLVRPVTPDDVNSLSVSYVRSGNTLPIRVPYLIPGI